MLVRILWLVGIIKLLNYLIFIGIIIILELLNIFKKDKNKKKIEIL